ncbi:MAG: tRNA(Ile)-lysidine [Desulfovibrionaceae bacterium]|nr:MAG: tRNA(Ile)-lysidine [Desulfovibrionaceae bacterium]
MPALPGLQDLPPWAARLCLRVESFLSDVFPETLEGRPVVLAVSGGLDSIALTVVFQALSKRLGYSLIVAHMDHGLRAESAQDAAFVANFCQETGLPCRGVRRDVAALAQAWKTGIEDAGRRARYDWLEEVRQQREAVCIAMAHHLDDLAEDQLLRLIRGAGWPALGGMRAWDGTRRVLRPLLMTRKAELRRLLEELGLPWREDASNQDPAYARNRVRADILPLLTRENSDYLGAAAELWRQARLDEIHWNHAMLAASDSPSQGEGPVFLTNTTLRSSSQALRLRLYKRAVDAAGPGQALAGQLHNLDKAWRKRLTGKTIQFPGGKVARVERGGISFAASLSSNSPISVDTGLPRR